ncbi:MAG: hydroxysqualene dehydroxylase HpnE [Bryobacteraceae bacterium]|nr:hydroxysqualene dehydroxylase HpnE [Bryobacteraceae bacterium]
MSSVVVIGGGLAGLASAAALGSAGFDVTVIEARAFLGGRATSYPAPGGGGEPEFIDNCQHILLRCCVNLLDFYERLGVADRIRFHREFYFIEPGGRISTLAAGAVPAPLHFAASFLRLPFLGAADKLAIGRALAALRRESKSRGDLDRITMLDWLRDKRQTEAAIERFWRQILVSAINEELDRMAACHGFQVMAGGFLASKTGYHMGVPATPLGELYGLEAWNRMKNVRFEFRSPVERVLFEGDGASGVRAAGREFRADYYICCLPFERVTGVAPEAGIDLEGWGHSPITGIHLWFDRQVTDLPYATLLDRTIQWFFNKRGGRYLQVVVSASRTLLPMERPQVIRLAAGELAEFLPRVGEAAIEKAHVVKEVRATFSATPEVETRRPGPATRFRNFFLAGDWTRSGWPATMEGAVRSGYIAAEAVAREAGRGQAFLLPQE